MMFREMGEGTQLCKAINRCGRRKTREEKRRERTYIYIYVYKQSICASHFYCDRLCPLSPSFVPFYRPRIFPAAAPALVIVLLLLLFVS